MRFMLHDRGTLRSPRELADGTIIVEAVLGRSGLQEYRRDGRTVIEYRPPEEVFDPESMASYELMAVTDYHPDARQYPEGVTVENRTELGRGSVVPGSLRRDGDLLIGSLHITDANLIAAMRAGRNQISCGYFQENDRTPGTTPDGRRYDSRQLKVRGNHIAVVDVARAGEIASARMDSTTTDKDPDMFKTLEEATAAYKAEKMRADAADSALATANKERDTAQAERDTAVNTAKKAEQMRLDGERDAMSRARARVTLENSAAKILTEDGKPAPTFTVDGADGKPVAMTDTAIRRAVVAKLTGKEIPADKSDAYVEARYDAEIEALAGEDKAIAEVREPLRRPTTPTTDAADEVSKARADMINRNTNAWMPAKK